MKTIGFIGAYDKIDFIMCIAKILTTLGKKVLVVDGTTVQKARYIVPTIDPTKSYVTEFEKIDVSVGFNDYDEIKRYLGLHSESELEYDIALIDIDNNVSFEKFNIKNCERNYFVTSFDLYSLKKGLEILRGVIQPIKLTKIYFARDILKEEDEYLNFLSLGTKVLWDEEDKIYLPMNDVDQNVIITNQRVAKIGIKKLSTQYKDGLYYVLEDVLKNEIPPQEIKKAFRILEKEV